jgi:ligand-binding sensor domain-containing protein
MFTTYTPSDNDQLTKAINTVIETRDGGIWFGTRQGLFYVDRGGGRVELRVVDIGAYNSRGHEYISSILEDRYGTIWIGTPTGLYRRWPDGSVARYGKENRMPDENIYALLEDRRGSLWVGTRDKGLFRLAISPGHEAPIVTSVYNKRRAWKDWVFDIYESSDGALLAGTNTEFLEFHDGSRYLCILDRQREKPVPS